eukprot:g1660.t1
MAAPLAAVMSVQSSRQSRCWVGCKTAASKFGGGFANRCRNLASMIPRKVWPIYAVYLAMQVLDTTAGPLFLSFLRTLVICDSHLTPAAAANPNPNPSDNWTGSMFCDDVNTVIQKAQERKGKLDCLMSCAHALSIPAFGLLCDRRGRKYMLILAIWGLILFYVILLLLSLWVAPSAQDKLMYLGSSALSRDPVWGTRMGSQLDLGKELSSSAANSAAEFLGATTRRRASRRPPSLDEVELHERPDEEAATSGSGSSASQTAYDWWPDQLLERAVGGRAVEQKLKEALKQEASQAAFKPVLFNDRAAGQEAVRDSKATSEKEKVKEEKQENEAKEKEEAKEKQKVEEKQGTIGTSAADANKAEVSTPTAIAKHETGSAAGVAAETPAQQAQTTAQQEQTRAAAGDMKTTKQEDAVVKGTSTEEKKKLLAAWASGSGSAPPAQQAPQSAAAQAQPSGNEGAANRAPAGTEKVAKNLRDQQAQHAAAAPAQPISPAPVAGGKTTTAALAGSSASGSDAAHQQIPKNSQVLVTSVSSTDVESITTAQGAGALVGKKKGPFRRLYEWIVEHLELLLLICAYLVRGFFKTSYIAFHSMIFDTTSLGNERVLVFALLDILTQICVLVSGLVSSTLLENEFTDFPALYSTMALLYCVLLVVVSNHLKETLSVSIHDFLACLDDPEPEVDLEKESLLGGGGGNTTTSQHLAGGVTGSGRPAFSTYDASQEGQLAPLTTDRAVDTSFSATKGGGNFSRSTIMFMGMAGKEQHAFKGGCGPLRRLMLGVAGVVDYFTDMFNSYLKLFFESSAFIQLWTVQCFFFTMATCMSEITSSYSIAVWSWHQGDLEFMSACMMLVNLFLPRRKEEKGCELKRSDCLAVERRSADGKRKVKLVLLDDNLVEDDVDLGRPMKSSIHDLAGHSGPWKNGDVCGKNHAPSGAAPGSFFSAPSASTGGAQLDSSATPRANNVIQISVNRRDEASLHTVVDDGSVFDGDEDGEGSERQDLENIQHNNAAKPAVFFYPESADADADVGGSRPNFGGEEKSDYVETEDEGPDHLRAGRDENGGDKMNSTVQTVGENARSGQEETVGGAVGCGVVEQENAVCAFTAPPRLHQPSGVADTAGLRRIHTPHAGADASDGERTGTTAVKVIGDEAGRRPAAGFRRGEGEAVAGLRRVSKHDPHVDSRASDLNVVQAPSALRNEGLDDYYEQRPAAALPAPSSARSVPGGRFSHPGEHSSSLVEGLPSGRGLLRKRAVSFSSMVVTHHSEAEQEPEQWRTQERFSDAEASLHERYASLLIMGCVVNLVCELIYTAEAPYSGRFFVFMNVIRHSMAFLASIRSSFIAARLPSDKRAMCLSFFSLTSEISQAFGCYLYANLLFDPAARGFAAGLPFRFAFLMYVLADFIYIYVFYTKGSSEQHE